METTPITPEAPTPPPGALPEQDREDAVGQYVTFFIENESFAFPLASVLEIIRVPDTVKVPLAPRSLLGLANLRGSVLPILDLRRILSLPDDKHTDATRVIVTDVGTPVGLVVDRVAQVLNVDRSKIESSQSVQSTVRAELMTGVVKDVGGRSLVQLLDVNRCVSLEFAAVVNAAKAAGAKKHAEVAHAAAREEDEAEDDSAQIVSFVVDGQEYAFPIADVEEIVRLPDDISKVPRADQNVLGIINLRNRLLPLVGMRRIFGLKEADLGDNERVLVVTLSRDQRQRESVGIVVDQVREVLRVEADIQDKMPALLTKSGVENRISSVCRLEDGKRLVSVLSSKALFEHQVVQSAVEKSKHEEEREMKSTDDLDATEDDDNKLVVFQLAAQEYGVMVEAVQEIIRVPTEMSRVPKTEAFIEGMVNLRGSVLPVLDMRARFGMDRTERNDRQRILVFNQGGVCTGFIVDSVSEVLRLGRSVMEDAPRLSDEQARIMGRVANLKDQKRMIQILNAKELVSGEEMARVPRK
jgi:purine-binding chemotaxis protein CheW